MGNISEPREIKYTSFDLTEEQANAIQSIREFYKDPKNKLFGLFGPGGTGKTSIVSELLRDIHVPTALAAFTNKAKKVLKQKCSVHENITASTLHSLFALQIREDRKIVVDNNRKETWMNYRFFVIDECSMIHDELFSYIIQKLQGRHILFVGDWCQLPPVGQNTRSLSFNISDQITLQRVMRYADNSELSHNANSLRSQIVRSTNYKLPYPSIARSIITCSNEQNVFRLEDGDSFFDLAIELFKSESYQQSSDFCKVLALNNDTVKNANERIRRALFGEEVQPFQSSEQLILLKPLFEKVVDERYIGIADTSDILVIIKKFDIETVLINTLGFEESYLYYRLQVQLEDKNIKFIRVLASDEEHKKHLLHQKQVVDFILANNKSNGYWWKQYYELKDHAFATVDYNYALTIHKAQGSTYNNVFLIESNFSERRNRAFSNETLWKAKYVAATRASEYLFVV